MQFLPFRNPVVRNGIVLGLATLCLATALIFFGLDFTDTGYSATMAWMQAAHPDAALWDFNSFGSAFLAGYWFFTGADSLLAYRFQWALMITATTLLAYRILTWFYSDSRAVALALTPTLLLAVFNSEEGLIVEYHNLPGFLALVSAAFFFRCFTPERSNRSPKRIRLFSALAGFFAAITILSRAPMALWCFAVAALLAFALWRLQEAKVVLRIGVWFIAGLILGLLASVSLLYARGFSLEYVWEASARSIRAVNAFHDYAASRPELGYYPLTISTAIRYGKILGMGAVAFIVALAWRRVPFLGGGGMRNRAGKILEATLLASLAVGIVLIVVVFADKSLGFHYGPITSFLLGAPLLIVGYIFIAAWRNGDWSAERQMLTLAAFAFFVLVSLGGSGVWVSNFRHGVWLVFPIALLEMQVFSSKHLDFRFVRRALIVGALTLGVALRVQTPYREQPVYRLESRFQAPELRGIFSSRGRAENLDQALAELRARGLSRGEKLQAYPSMAMIYFITKTIPWHPHPWIGQMWTTRQDIVAFAQKANQSSFPRLVVRAKFDPNMSVSLDASREYRPFQLGYAPDRLFYGEYAYSHDCSTYLDSLFLVEKGYRIVWENKGFAIMEKPTRGEASNEKK
jgi:hypothetical protein